MILRPFKVGDFVTAAGVTGTVEEIGLFATTLNTPDNVKTMVGDGKLFGDTIQNFSANPYRRVDLTAQLAHDVDPKAAIALLKPVLAQVPNVMAKPAPDVEILTFNLSGAVLAVRPYCNNEHYWQVYFDTNRLIRDTFAHAGFPVPEQHYTVRGPGRSQAGEDGLGGAASDEYRFKIVLTGGGPGRDARTPPQLVAGSGRKQLSR